MINNNQYNDQRSTGSPSRIRKLGAYYTSDEIASSIAAWAIKSGNENILEPSAGAGALLRAAYERANQIRPRNSLRAAAFDIDSRAIINLRKLDLEGLQVYRADFLKVKPDLHEKFDLVLANPPFTRNHEISPVDRELYRTRFGMSGAVGLWVYFILHSLAFLRQGGRIASIVPKSVLFTLHGRQLLQKLSLQFSNVGAYELASKPVWSSYAEEVGAVILADGFKTGSSRNYEQGLLQNDGLTAPLAQSKSAVYCKIVEQATVLGDIASLSIGVVTGRNEVFLLNEEERLKANIELVHVRPVVSRRRQISGITLTATDLEELASKGHRTWLLSPNELTQEIEQYLQIITEEDRKSVVWFKKRSPWWKVQIASKYDAVFTYMNDLGPRLVRLDSNIVCTNTLHKVQFKDRASGVDKNSAILSPISTFGQLAAEKIGRCYSGGVLKFEIADARSLPIISCNAFDDDLVQRVDNILRGKSPGDATAEVDKAFMPPLFGATWRNALNELKAELERLRLARRKTKK